MWDLISRDIKVSFFIVITLYFKMYLFHSSTPLTTRCFLLVNEQHNFQDNLVKASMRVGGAQYRDRDRASVGPHFHIYYFLDNLVEASMRVGGARYRGRATMGLVFICIYVCHLLWDVGMH